MKKYIVIVSMILLFCGQVFLDARPHKRLVDLKSGNNFYKHIGASELAVVLFYGKDIRKNRHSRHSGSRQDNYRGPNYDGDGSIERIFEGMSQVPRFKEGRVRFIMVNIEREKLSSIADDFRVEVIPTVMIFEDGKPIVKDRKSAMLEGDISSEQLRSFIDENCGTRISTIIHDRAEARREAAERSYYYWGMGYPYYYWNYPYYGYRWGGGYWW